MHATFLPGVMKTDGQNVPGIMSAKPNADESEDAFDSVFGDLEAMQRPIRRSGDQLEPGNTEVDDQPSANTAATPSQDKVDVKTAQSESPATINEIESEHLGKANSDFVTKALRHNTDAAAVLAADTIDQTGPALEPDQILSNAIASKQSNIESAPAHVVGIRTGTAAALVNGIAFGGSTSPETSIVNSAAQSAHNATFTRSPSKDLNGAPAVHKKSSNMRLPETFVIPPTSPATTGLATPEAQRDSTASSFQPKPPAAFAEPNQSPVSTARFPMSDPGKAQSSVAASTNDVLPAKDFETKMKPFDTPDRTLRSPLLSQANFESAATAIQTPSRHAPIFHNVQLQTRASATPGSDRIQHVSSDASEKIKLETGPHLTRPGAANAFSTGVAGIQQQLRVADANVSDRSLQFPNDMLDEFAWDLRPQLAPAGTANTGFSGRAEMPPQIMQLITEAMHRSPDKAIEIALSPAELGRVRMVLTTSEGGIIVNILAERADTLDLMRRNIDDLGRSFSELGYADISFAFGKGGEASDNPDPPTKEHAVGDVVSLDFTDAPVVPATAQPRLAITDDGVDMRV